MAANSNCRSFLASVLGKDGAKAILKAADHSSGLQGAVVPRAIQAWLNSVKTDFSGPIPGQESSFIQVTKSEGLYTGTVSIGADVYTLNSSTAAETLAAVAVALDLDKDIEAGSVRDIDLERLGKSLDVLAKAQVLKRKMAEKEELEKGKPQDGDKSPVAAPLPPVPPEAPQTEEAPAAKPPTPFKGKPAKSAKPAKPVSVLKLSETEACTRCPMCGGRQFTAQHFTGCLCFRDLAKSAKVTAYGAQITLELGEHWDADAIQMLLTTVGR